MASLQTLLNLWDTWSTEWTKAALGSLVFCSKLSTAASCREFLHEPAHRTLPEACSDWKHQWSLAEAKAKSTEDVLPFLELMTCHHRVKSSLMRETYQWKIHQPNKQQVSTEASWTQAYAGRGKILMTWFLVSGSSTSIWMMKILSYRTVVVYMCSEGQRSWKVPCRR